MPGKSALAPGPRYGLGALGLGVVASLVLPAAALAVSGARPSSAAEQAVRWGSLIGLVAVLLVLLLGRLFGARISTLVVGTDHRISTSKTIASVWTVVVAAVLVGLVYAKLLNHPQALDRTDAAGVIGQYAVLFGGPLGAAILAKQIVTSQVAQSPGVKTAGKSHAQGPDRQRRGRYRPGGLSVRPVQLRGALLRDQHAAPHAVERPAPHSRRTTRSDERVGCRICGEESRDAARGGTRGCGCAHASSGRRSSPNVEAGARWELHERQRIGGRAGTHAGAGQPA